MKKLPLTKRERDAYMAIKSYIRIHGFAPLLKEIALLMGMKGNDSLLIQNAFLYIERLIHKGYLRKEGKKRSSRNIQII